MGFFKKIWWYLTSSDTLLFNFLVDIFGLIFRLLAFVGLQTPTIIFTNPITLNAVKVTSLASVVYVIGAWTYESFARMLNKPFNLKYTPFRLVVKRMPLAFGLGVSAPLVLTFFAKIANGLSALLNSNTANLISNPTLNGLEASIGEILSLLIFDIFFIYMLLPIIVKNAVRWWDMFTLTIISPLVLARSIFGNNNNVIKDWFEKVKELLSVQLINSGYIALLALILCASNATGFPFLFKMIMIIGGMFRIGNPPDTFMKANGFNKDEDYGSGFWKNSPFSPLNKNEGKKGWFFTNNPLSPLNKYKVSKEEKRKVTLEKRRMTGRRSI